MTGTRPVIDFMFADFVLDSVGEIINQIAKMQYMSSGRLKMPIYLQNPFCARVVLLSTPLAVELDNAYFPWASQTTR